MPLSYNKYIYMAMCDFTYYYNLIYTILHHVYCGGNNNKSNI